MKHYIEAIRAAAAKCEPHELKPRLDFILETATEEYKAGALDVLEYDEVATEYADTLKNTNVVNYV